MKTGKVDNRVGVGSSSVLMILVALAMTALGLLALGSARQTEAHTQRNLQASLGYASAAAAVQQRLAEIDEAAAEYLMQSADKPPIASWFTGRNIENVAWSGADGAVRFTITEDAGDGRALIATGELLTSGDERYRLTSHKLTASPSEQAQNLVLMGE